MSLTEYYYKEVEVSKKELDEGIVIVVLYKPLEGYRLIARHDGKEVSTEYFDNPVDIRKYFEVSSNLLKFMANVYKEFNIKEIKSENIQDVIFELSDEAYKKHYLAHLERKRALPKPNVLILGKPITVIKKTIIPILQDDILRYIEIDNYRDAVNIKAYISNKGFSLNLEITSNFKDLLKRYGVDTEREYIILHPYDEPLAFVYIDDKGEIVFADEYIRQGYNEVFEEYLTHDEIAKFLEMLDLHGRRMLIKYAKQFYKNVTVENINNYLGVNRIPVKRVSLSPPKQYIEMILKDWDEVLSILFNKEVFDEKMIEVYSGYALENYWIEYATHGFVITPSGTGKTVFADALGIRIDDTSAPGLFGTVTQTEKGTGHIIKGKIQGQRCLIQIEQMEYKKYSNPLQGLLNAMRTGKVVRELAYGEVVAKTTSPIVFTNNPVPDRIALMVGDLGKLAGNEQALGGRIQLFLFATSMKPANKFVKDDNWDWAVTSLRYIRASRDFIRRWRRLVNDNATAKFLQDTTLDSDIRQLSTKFYNPPSSDLEGIYEFMKTYCLVKKWGLHYHSLVRAVLPHVKELVHGNIKPIDLIKEAYHYHERIIKVIIESIHEFINSIKAIGFIDYLRSSTKLTIAIVTAILMWINDKNLWGQYGVYRKPLKELKEYIKDTTYMKKTYKDFERKVRIAFIEGGVPRPLLNAGVNFIEDSNGEIYVEVDLEKFRNAVNIEELKKLQE